MTADPSYLERLADFGIGAGRGWLVYAADPNDPDANLEAIAGGLVVDVASCPLAPGSGPPAHYRAVRSWRGQVRWSTLVDEPGCERCPYPPPPRVLVAHPPDAAQATAGGVYMALVRSIAKDRGAKHGHRYDLEAALIAHRVWARLEEFAP